MRIKSFIILTFIILTISSCTSDKSKLDNTEREIQVVEIDGNLAIINHDEATSITEITIYYDSLQRIKQKMVLFDGKRHGYQKTYWQGSGNLKMKKLYFQSSLRSYMIFPDKESNRSYIAYDFSEKYSLYMHINKYGEIEGVAGSIIVDNRLVFDSTSKN